MSRLHRNMFCTAVLLTLACLVTTPNTIGAQDSVTDRLVGQTVAFRGSTYSFEPGGRFRAKVGSQTYIGTWKVSGDQVTMIYRHSSGYNDIFEGRVTDTAIIGRGRSDAPNTRPGPEIKFNLTSRPVNHDADILTISMNEFAPERITDAAESLANQKEYQPEGNVTKCNFFVRDMAAQILGSTPPEMAGTTANEMYDKMVISPSWYAMPVGGQASASFQKVQSLANEGKLVVVGYRNPDPKASGHVAVVVPNGKNNTLPTSGTWGGPVPYIAQAGKTVFAKDKLSFGFTPDKKNNMKIFIKVKKR